MYLVGPKRRVVVSAGVEKKSVVGSARRASPIRGTPKQRVLISASSPPPHIISKDRVYISPSAFELCVHNVYHKKQYLEDRTLHRQLCCPKANYDDINLDEGDIPEFIDKPWTLEDLE